MLLDDLQRFYDDPDNFAILRSVVSPGKEKAAKRTQDEEGHASYSNISLRVLEFCVTEYARLHKVRYKIPGRDLPFMMYESCCQLMSNHGKNNFDTFARRKRESLSCNGQTVCTTCGQANLLRWAIKHKVLQYISDHLADIKLGLREHSKQRAARKAAEAETLVKPLGIKKRNRKRKSMQDVRTPALVFSHKADKPVYKVKFGF